MRHMVETVRNTVKWFLHSYIEKTRIKTPFELCEQFDETLDQ